MEDFRKYRWFFTASGKMVIGGKNALQNDQLLSSIKHAGYERLIMHTSEPGSPFCVISADLATLSQQDIRECAIFTGCFSKAWKSNSPSTVVDIFHSSQLHKNKGMNAGTWGVYGKVQRITVPLELVITKQQGVLRAVPEISLMKKQKSVLKICPGTIEKNDMLTKLELELDDNLRQDEVLSALPTGGFRVCRV
ncbi:DUF814 domain-containing protein [Candidatus Pacearchaeota archaeon]|nr:DUF814 domain-containing protein [Candidatus Pacearchaeota archaeon]